MLDQVIAHNVRESRAARALSLEELAAKSGVSRSMISLIERGESSPTAVVLEKLAAALDVTLASLFAPPQPPGGPVARRDEQPVWRDPESGYVRRNVSPPGVPQPMQLVEVQFPPRGPRVPAGVGARRHDRGHGGEGALPAPRGRLPGDGARRADDVPQSDAQDGALRGGDLAMIRRLLTVDDAQIDGLAAVLIDCIEGGASVSFMLPLSRERIVAYWRGVADDVAAGRRALLVAEDAEGICGTVHLQLAQPENQPHRADLLKMLVHRRARRRGLGEALLRAAEATARECGKTLLVLDTASDDAERLYARNGWVRVGIIPDYALLPGGGFCDTVVYYRRL